MEFNDVVESRHSVRDFEDKPLPEYIVRKIARVAQHTPTWVNSQPTKIYIVSGDAAKRLRERFREAHSQGVDTAAEIQPLNRDQWPQWNQNAMAQWTTEFKETFKPGQVNFYELQNNLFRAPTFAFFTVGQNLSEWSTFDAGAFVNSFVLAAKNEGVDSIIAYVLVTYPAIVREIAQIPNDEKLIVGVALGYASSHPINTFIPSRIPVDDVLHVVSK
ncbi:nitroreductase [Alloscardovia venturai]|uniref:Nitroreductase n=1 Tax=Alloscardovia venturai TaxID=1769421 RepID=A0ABW2Y6S8_9BIFI